jgi:hypothetical protein
VKTKRVRLSSKSKVTRLKAGAYFGEPTVSADGQELDREALLVFDGSFESMDGPVDITRDHVERLAKNFGERLARLAGGDGKITKYPPVQLDHSTSARDTVGRLMGPVEAREHTLEDGRRVLGLFAKCVRFLGAENVEKAKDGRYGDLSIGANLETCEIDELSVVPFPAAKGSTLLSGAQGENVNKEKLKKRFMEQDKLSAEDADKKLAAMSEEDCEKELSRLSADDEKQKLAAQETEKKEAGEKLAAAEAKSAKLAAGKDKLAALVAAGKPKAAAVQLAARTNQIQIRLARLRADTKITPAEQKTINIAELAAKGQETIDAVLQTYEKREPVVFVGQYGSIKAIEASKLKAQMQSVQLEAEVRSRFSSNPKNKKLADATAPSQVGSTASGPAAVQAGAPDEQTASLLALSEAMEKHLAAGDSNGIAECLAQLREMLSKAAPTPVVTQEAEAQMAALRKQVDELTAHLSEYETVLTEMSA